MTDRAAGLSRRAFLGTVFAAAAAGLSRGRWGRVAIPLTRRPPELVPGMAAEYASTCPLGPRALAVLVKTREGRPILVTGNDRHPELAGRTCVQAMAGIQSLYSAERLEAPRLGGQPIPWPRALDELLQALRRARRDRKPILLLTGATRSPSRLQLLAALQKALPTLEHLAWEPGLALGAQEGALAAFGSAASARPRLAGAQCVLSLGDDCLDGADPAVVRAFALGRRAPAMNRLWVLEGPLTLTGTNADHRIPVRPTALAALAFALAQHLHRRHGVPLPTGVHLPELPEPGEVPAPAWSGLLQDLLTAGPKAAVLCGEGLPAPTHVAAHLLNAMLGSRAVELVPAPRLQGLEELTRAVEAMAGGHYAAALIWGANPAYAFPDPPQWRAALARVPLGVWLGTDPDETAAQCRLLLPEHHWLEAWGDHVDGRYLTLQQPAVGPLYDTRQGEDVLRDLLRGLGEAVPETHLAGLRERLRREVHPRFRPVPFERFWQAALHEGVLPLPEGPAPAFRGACVAEAARKALTGPAEGLELALHPATFLGDGRYAGSGWLQELPDPVTKTTWGHPLRLAPEDAAAAGLADGDLARVQAGGVSGVFSVLTQPGQARGTLAAALGYGRLAGAARGVGTNAFPFTGAAPGSPHLLSRVTLAKARGRMELPATRGHHALEGPPPARALELSALGALVREAPDLATLYPAPAQSGHRWGMAIDLSACVGCAACVLACQAENNIPVVGPRQVARGREMHWLRIDTTWLPSGPVHQPMLCQHCEAAPCESVCPVNATNHSPEGLNQMVYNRCVGTRYCADNCPYKVRRFNYLDYTGGSTEPEALAFNPEVTVRSRGVMEKCTFCVQRIEAGRMRAKGEGRALRDGDLTPACAAACPGEAIVFGDLADPGSRAARLSREPRGYRVLEELGARPVITYLARIRNRRPGVQP